MLDITILVRQIKLWIYYDRIFIGIQKTRPFRKSRICRYIVGAPAHQEHVDIASVSIISADYCGIIKPAEILFQKFLIIGKKEKSRVVNFGPYIFDSISVVILTKAQKALLFPPCKVIASSYMNGYGF